MKLRDHAEAIASDAIAVLDIKPSDEQMARMVDAVEKGVIEVALEARNRSADVAMNRSSRKKDMAYQIAQEIRRASEVLITNLSSLR